MPSHRELAGARLTASAYAVAHAVDALRAEGIAPTVAQVIEATGYSRAQVYEARAELRRRWPDEYPAPHGSGTAESDGPDGPVERTTPGQAVVPRLDKAALMLPGVVDVEPAPRRGLTLWREALAAATVPLDGARSWDAYDVYSDAWDQVLEAVPPDADPFRELIPLAVDYCERMTGEQVDRKKIALLIRQFGKAALYGLSKALGTTDGDTDRDRYRYARAVAARVVDDLYPEDA